MVIERNRISFFPSNSKVYIAIFGWLGDVFAELTAVWATQNVREDKMMRRIAVLGIIVGLLLAINSALADDYNPPEWRGAENTTFAIWEFGSDQSIVAPDSYVNPGGTPMLTVAGDFPFTAWVQEDYGHFGVWKFEDYIVIDLPNIIDNEPHKEIWIQLTYAADSIGQGFPPTFLTQPGGSTPILVNQEQVDDVYWHETYSITIEPNPDFETIWIQPRNCTFYVDEIVIDTISTTPEPASICLLGMGALVLLRKRKF